MQLATGSTVGAVNTANFKVEGPDGPGYTTQVDVAFWGVYTNFSYQLQVTYDSGVTWIPVGAVVPVPVTGGKFTLTVGCELALVHRLAITVASPTGTLNYRVGQ